ncbi:MAG: hypothetical protein NC210_07085, partial [[Clostridium] fimetarium]|nr:hypothetical protein [[Clostridium] fimetarium]
LSAASKAPASATWEAAGKGMWKEGLLDRVLPETMIGSSWEVEFEQAKEQPGYYRLLPYATGTPVAEVVGKADDENYVYINATNPAKVYIEDFFAFGSILITNLVPENEWDNYSFYGVEKEGVITFQPSSFAYATYDTAEYLFCNTAGSFQVALPGAELRDYQLELDIPACAENREMTISVTAGEDIAEVKLMTSFGYFRNSDSNDKQVALNGAEMDKDKGFVTLELRDDAPMGVYTTIAVGLDKNGDIAASRCAYSHVLDDNDADWAPCGTATLVEAILTTVYNTAPQVVLTCDAEQSVSQPGRYRLVNPYAGHSWSLAYDDFLINHEHNHYIYLNAVDPRKVYVEAAPLGINSDGEAMLYSLAGRYVDAGNSSYAEQNGLFGRLLEDDGELIISMPDGSLMFAETKYDCGAYHQVGANFMAVISPRAGDAVEEIAGDDSDAPAEYYNLQGIRVAHPRAGELVIERRGEKVTKRVIR